MIIIKGVSKVEKEALEAAGFVRDVRLNLNAPTTYDITLGLEVQLITRMRGIDLFDFRGTSVSHYIDEELFIEVTII